MKFVQEVPGPSQDAFNAMSDHMANHYTTFGTTSYTIQVSAGGHAEAWIPFGVTYSSAPVVVCCLGGEQFKGFANPCQIKTNEFQVRIDNVGGAVGNPVVKWIAVGTL